MLLFAPIYINDFAIIFLKEGIPSCLKLHTPQNLDRPCLADRSEKGKVSAPIRELR